MRLVARTARIRAVDLLLHHNAVVGDRGIVRRRDRGPAGPALRPPVRGQPAADGHDGRPRRARRRVLADQRVRRVRQRNHGQRGPAQQPDDAVPHPSGDQHRCRSWDLPTARRAPAGRGARRCHRRRGRKRSAGDSRRPRCRECTRQHRCEHQLRNHNHGRPRADRGRLRAGADPCRAADPRSRIGGLRTRCRIPGDRDRRRTAAGRTETQGRHRARSAGRRSF